MQHVVFVAPYAMEATVRFVEAFVAQDDARVGVVSSDPLERFPESVRSRLAAHWRVPDCLDPDQLAHGVGSVGARMDGRIDALTGVLEPLQVPLGTVRDRLGIAGMSAEVAENFRDKARMKTVLAAAGVPCARHARADDADSARAAALSWEGPVVVKPLAGMGAKDTFRIDDRAMLERWLDTNPPTPEAPVVLEEFLTGLEFSFDSVFVDGEMRWHSISRYDPAALTVVENPWIQWAVVLPKHIDGDEYAGIRTAGEDAVRALGMTTGLSHLEWFLRPDGSVAISEVGARPPGGEIATLISWAHDVDMHTVWAELTTHGRFDPPERRHAVGAAYLRAQGAGRRITSVTGLDGVSERTRRMIVASRVPTPGDPTVDRYEGEGYVIVRADSVDEVEAAVREVVSAIRVECA